MLSLYIGSTRLSPPRETSEIRKSRLRHFKKFAHARTSAEPWLGSRTLCFIYVLLSHCASNPNACARTVAALQKRQYTHSSTHYAPNYAYANSFLLCLKLCQHNVREPNRDTAPLFICTATTIAHRSVHTRMMVALVCILVDQAAILSRTIEFHRKTGVFTSLFTKVQWIFKSSVCIYTYTSMLCIHT